MENLKSTKLASYSRTVATVGGTGDGKSQTSILPAASNARKILSELIGETNSTLKEKKLVYTEACENDLVIAAKIPDDIMDKQEYLEMILRSLASVIKKKGGMKPFTIVPEDFKSELSAEIVTKVNSRAKLSLIPTEKLEELTTQITDLFVGSAVFTDHCFTIYNAAKNNLPSDEVKKNSAKFEAAIKSEAETLLNTLDKMFQDKLAAIWETANEALKRVFFKYFKRDDISIDKYYFVQIDLDKPEEHLDFINAVFSSNDIRSSKTLSIEVLCSELIIYAPLNPAVKKILESNGNVFRGSDNKVSISFLDTRGLFHSEDSDGENKEYLSDLLYTTDYDALLFVCPMCGDTNASKLRELYVKALTGYKKQLPLFVLHNKADMFIGELQKSSNSDDPFSDEDFSNTLGIDVIIKNVTERVESIRSELQQVQHKSRKNLQIISLPCCLKKDKSLPKDIWEKYNPVHALRCIFDEIGKHFKDNATKIRFKTTSEENENLTWDFDEGAFRNAILSMLESDETIKSVVAPTMQNIAENLGKTPHGNAYNALKRRLRIGQSYTSDIDESYFYNCKSFSIKFPGNLRNFVSEEFIRTLLSYIKYDGGYFENSDNIDEFCNKCVCYFNEYDFVAHMTFFQAIVSIESNLSFGFKQKFNDFLHYCRRFFYDFDSSNVITNNTKPFEVAIRFALENAINKAVAYNVLYT